MKLRLFTLFFVVMAVGLWGYVRHFSDAPFHKRSYGELRPLLTKLEREKIVLQGKSVNPETFQEYQVAIGMVSRDIESLKKEITLRQINLLLAIIAGFFVFVSLVITIYRLIRYGWSAGPIKGFYHDGEILIDPPSVEYVERELMHSRKVGGFLDRKEAERWLRTDDFLKCSYCSTKVKADHIGSVQEVVFLEEVPLGVPKDQTERLGSIWMAKPRDRYKCEKCGRTLVRTAR